MDNDLDQRTKAENLVQATKEIEDAIKSITSKDFSNLTSEDKEFLYARRNSLSRDQRNYYKNVFKQVEDWHTEKAKKEAEDAKAHPVITNVDPEGFPPAEPNEVQDDDGEDEVG